MQIKPAAEDDSTTGENAIVCSACGSCGVEFSNRQKNKAIIKGEPARCCKSCVNMSDTPIKKEQQEKEATSVASGKPEQKENTTTFDIVKIEKDESNENYVLVETKSHCFRLSPIESGDIYRLQSVKSKDDGNILLKATQVVTKNIVEHPLQSLAIGVPLAIAGVGVSATLAGFGAAGIVGGSVAAGIQSSIGNVAAGGLFAMMQSLGATGTFAAMTTGGLVTAGGAAVAVASSGGEGEEENEKNDGDHVETSNSKEDCIDDLQKLVGSKVMIVKYKELVVYHES
jgi:hypothetical protein